MNKILFFLSLLLFDCLTQKRTLINSKILLLKKTTSNTTAAKILPLSPLCLSFENDVGTRDEFTRRRRRRRRRRRVVF